ncbi:MAG: TonB family protein [Bacteroidetes bacterium]|nr:TonB family protein [Bacteroidota bacterium]
MKKVSSFFILFFSGFLAKAQDTVYYNTNWQTTDAAHASYNQVRVKSDAGWQVTDYYRSSGRVQMTGNFADDSFHVQNGRFTWYDEKGGINHRCDYVNGKLDGVDTLYYPNGRKKTVGVNKDGERDGEWIGYFPNGKMAGKAVYEKGKQVSSAFYNEDGTNNKGIKEFMKNASYPGGPAQLLRYLNKSLKYPDIAVKRKIEGTVVVVFKVSKEGTPSEFKVVQSVDKSLDEEALRVMREMKDWEPSIVGGVYSDSYIKQPVVFRF